MRGTTERQRGKGGTDRQAGRKELSSGLNSKKQIGSLERDKESHVTHIKGRLKVSKPKKVKVEVGAHFHPLHSFTEQWRSGLNCAASQRRTLKTGKSQKRGSLSPDFCMTSNLSMDASAELVQFYLRSILMIQKKKNWLSCLVKELFCGENEINGGVKGAQTWQLRAGETAQQANTASEPAWGQSSVPETPTQVKGLHRVVLWPSHVCCSMQEPAHTHHTHVTHASHVSHMHKSKSLSLSLSLFYENAVET